MYRPGVPGGGDWLGGWIMRLRERDERDYRLERKWGKMKDGRE